MAEIITNIQPGQYPSAQTLTVKFPAGTRKAIVTRDDRPPVLTEILAYDVGTIHLVPDLNNDPTGELGFLMADPANPNPVQRPFLAVTQDGAGNVIYDGGFPKFYNINLATVTGSPPNQVVTWPSSWPKTWAEMPPAFKYLINGLKFIANPRKVAAGNKKVLFVNNSQRSYIYNVLQSHYSPDPLQWTPEPNDPNGYVPGGSGFRDSFDCICEFGGWEPHYYDLTTKINQGGTGLIDLKFTDLDEYAAVVFLGSYATGNMNVPVQQAHFWVTEAFGEAMALYRQAGNGVCIITDHCGNNYTSLADAVAKSGTFGPDPTRVAKHYGAYFTGNVDRQPVSVGEIRRQIGLPGPPKNHPLLDNMVDTDKIFAGGSESIIAPALYASDTVDHTQDLVVPMTTPGVYRVNVLVQMDDGSILTRPMKFTIINPSDLEIQNGVAGVVGANYTTYKLAFDYTLHSKVDPDAVFSGEILKNGVLQGYFETVGANTKYHMLAGRPGMPVNNSDTIAFSIKVPYEYTVSSKITIADRDLVAKASGSVSTYIKALRSIPEYVGKTDESNLADVGRYANTMYADPPYLNVEYPSWYWYWMGKQRQAFVNLELGQCNIWIAPNLASWNTTKPTNPQIGTSAIIADTNDVWFFCNIDLSWKKHSQKADVLFGERRTVLDQQGGKRWIIKTTGTVLDPRV